VAFRAPTSTSVEFFFSPDAGTTWQSMNPTPGVPIAAVDAGVVQLKLPSLPTPRGLIRIVDMDREWLYDETDGTIEIMEARSVMITSPALGDELLKGSTTNITWLANRIARVNIEYSASAGSPGSWVRLASNFDAALATMPWNVPMQTTTSGKIRFTDAGGAVVAESGLFSIVDAPPFALHLDGPNGGESYGTGQKVTVRWSGVNVPRVSLRYSSDAGASWNPIAKDIPAINGRYEWTTPVVGGDQYRVQVLSVSPSVSDMSDANFTINAPVEPAIGLIYPSGGETLYVGDTVDLSWSMQGITTPVSLMYTVDDTTWTAITSLPAGSLTHAWIVPDEPTLARRGGSLHSAPTAKIIVAGGGLSDTSDGFSIERRVTPMVSVTSPNTSAVTWREGTQVSIAWDFAAVSNVDIMLSTDNGATWGTTIAQNALASLQTYSWTVPHLADTSLRSLVVRVSANPGGAPSDVSDVSFMYEPSPSGVAELTGVRQTMLFGNFPNPFATTTEIRWRQSISAPVTLRIYNQAGSLVHEESTPTQHPGEQRMSVSAGTMPSGVYLYELRIGGEAIRSLMTITR
jgi:hypothetical protein